MIQKITNFLKKDIVLSISMCLAIFSCFVSPPGPDYLKYIDFHTLILLFCLMLVIEGLNEESFFQYTGNRILSVVSTTKGLVFSLVFFCFISSMIITNDVALITFVPFGLMLLGASGMQASVCLTVTLMTVAANLGSMFTPIGNPQNLYLFSLSGMDLKSFFSLMLPYTLAAAGLLILFVFLGFRQTKTKLKLKTTGTIDFHKIPLYLFLFALCILTVAKLIPHIILLAVTCCCIFYKKRNLFRRIDYTLLLTFIFFFIFVGNLKHLEWLHQALLNILAGHERMFSIAASQIISNVPAAMLLSGYTDQIQELIIGTNIGGLGTLIASMASLISYRQIAARYPKQKKQYLLTFTIVNVIFLGVLLLI